MKKNAKRLLSLMLSLILVVGLIPNVARAEGTLLPAPVVTVEDGVATWPAIEGAAKYCYSYSVGGGNIKKDVRKLDLRGVLDSGSQPSGTYTFSIYAADESNNAISETATVTYTHTAHTHNWSTEWTYDKDAHWHACLNTPCPVLNYRLDEGFAYGGHTFVDNKCTVCEATQGSDSTPHFITVVNGTADKSQAKAGETITITAKATPTGMKFVGWTSPDGAIFADATATTTTFTMPSASVTVYANFEALPATYHVTVEGGTADKYEAEEGEAITITANEPDGMKFVGWEVTVNDMFVNVNLEDPGAAVITFRMPEGDVSVKAVFEEITEYHVTVVGGTADKEAAGENEYKAEPGDTITITAYDAPDGKKFVGWQVTVNDMFVDVDLADATAKETTFEMPEGNVRVDAVFEDVIPSTYKVQVVGGTADKTEYAPGETVTITAYEPASDKQFAKWTTEDGVTFADATKTTTTFTMPAKDVRVDATYEDKIPEKYKVQVVGGNADKTEYAPGETVTITAYEPASDKQFAKWTTEDGVTFADATKATTTFVMPAKDVRVDATYEDEIPSTYKVQVVGGNADKTEYAPGETVTITAYPPASDMQFAKWTTEDGVTFADATKATTTFVMPAKDVRVDATYEDEIPSTYKVTVVGGNADKTEYAPGETVTITAYPPASDMQFAKWTTEDGVTFADATKATTTFVMPAKDVRVDATYEDEVPAGELDDVPKTGDPMDLVLWGSLAMISAMAAAALIILQKKRVY